MFNDYSTFANFVVIVAIIAVCALPPTESCNILVNFESRYAGLDEVDSALITLPSDVNDKFILRSY